MAKQVQTCKAKLYWLDGTLFKEAIAVPCYNGTPPRVIKIAHIDSRDMPTLYEKTFSDQAPGPIAHRQIEFELSIILNFGDGTAVAHYDERL